jgi:hypothetical protein
MEKIIEKIKQLLVGLFGFPEKIDIIMPLKKSSSKKAFEYNLKAEMRSGKPRKQALAIAYSVKRKASRKKR